MVGKTNMDQFAAGLVGTRTPYGIAANAFDARFVPGGSSSGSGAIVGARLLTFALGTDTAGSGEVVTQLLQGTDYQRSSIGLPVDHPPLRFSTQRGGSMATAVSRNKLDLFQLMPQKLRPRFNCQ